MNPQEREVISGIFERLKQVENQPRDPEAEKYIAELVARQPYATYALAQAAFVQEQALKQYNDRVQSLEAELQQAREAPPPQPSGGFLSGLFGGGQNSAPPRSSVPPTGPQYGAQPPQYAQPGPQQPGPWGGAPQPGPGGPFGGGGFGGGGGGGGFLRGALTTAAGVAGGALLFEGIKGMFGGHGASASPFGSFGDPSQAAGNTTINEYFQNDPGAQKGPDQNGQDDIRDASYDDDDGGDYDDSGSDDDGWV